MIDSVTGQLAHAWLLILASEAPVQTQERLIKTKVNQFRIANIEFKNPVARDVLFELGSSRSDLMEPKNRKMSFKGFETQMIDLDIFPQQMDGNAEAYLYLSDSDQYVMECILIKIVYYS